MPKIIRNKGYTFSLFHIPPCVWNVGNVLKTTSIEHLNQVESVLLPDRPVPSNPEGRDHPEDGPLPPTDRLGHRPERRRGPGFDFDERHHLPPPGHQIDVVVAQPEPVGLDPPTRGFEIAGRRDFSGQAATMARVSPLLDGTNDIGRLHGPKDTGRPKPPVTVPTRTGA